MGVTSTPLGSCSCPLPPPPPLATAECGPISFLPLFPGYCGLAPQLSVSWELHENVLSLDLLPEMLIQRVEVREEEELGQKAVLTCPREAAHKSGCRGHQNSGCIISPPLLNTCRGFDFREGQGKGGPAGEHEPAETRARFTTCLWKEMPD